MREQKAGAPDAHARRIADTAASGSGIPMLPTRLRCAVRHARFMVLAAHTKLKIKAAARHASSLTAGRAVLRWQAWPCARR
ncbi:hypothetical protein CAI18_02605 [Xanthomonas citri pv. punicae]|uniref:Uncharacterized protein n=1 Tax=Xanthomonas campestris pv. malvacearum TaxID=86040 RepID=A0AA44Z2M5_XANCM|nr:hypothetical protein B7L66_17995 [Xanthomonas citri pv. citri]ASY83093.1 hypothetical protein CIW71_02585 [Xanthomonas citri pv. malvacearum]AZB52653.1 hypothetical protein BHE84_24780 [Xanthomonas citri pv. glycines str. 8ra]NMI13563.1 hypothetical protein [Xanthomonas citri]QCZ66238.1 hypothetical protein CAI14_18565 [Xanthomonas citri pv. punicae]QDR46968.1 hypothetical protein FPK90_21880 [Xanthomonas citri pv. glycines]